VAVSNSISKSFPPLGRAEAKRLVEDQVPTLRIVARGLYRDRADADDLVQDVIERALQVLDRIDPNVNPRGFLVTILHNLHIDRCRSRARRGIHVPAHDVPLVAEEAAPEPAWAALGVDELREGILQLSPELGSAYRMFALEGRPYDEIAAKLGISKATVGTRLLRARARLKEILSAKLTGAKP